MELYSSTTKLSLVVSWFVRQYEPIRHTSSSITNHWTSDLSNIVILYSKDFYIEFHPKLISQNLEVIKNNGNTFEVIDRTGGIAIVNTILDIQQMSKSEDYFCIEYSLSKLATKVSHVVSYINIGFLIPNMETRYPQSNTGYTTCVNLHPNNGFSVAFYNTFIRAFLSTKLENEKKIEKLFYTRNIEKFNFEFEIKSTFGLRIDLKGKSIDCFLNGEFVSSVFRNIPNYLIPCLDVDGKIGSRFSVTFVNNFD